MSTLSLDDYLQQCHSPDPNTRRNAAWNLGRFRDPRIAPLLIAMLRDPDGDVRLRAVESLGSTREVEASAALIPVLHSDPNPTIRERAAASLGSIGHKQALPVLLETLHAESATLRLIVVEALRRLPDAQSITPLTQMMLTDHDADLRYQASRAIADISAFIGPQTAVTELSQRVVDGVTNANHRFLIAEVLGMIGHKSAADALKALAQDPDEGVAETARWGLKRVDH